MIFFGPEPETLTMAVDEVLQEFLAAQGKPRLENETIAALASITIVAKEHISIEFVERIGTARHAMGRLSMMAIATRQEN